MFLNSHVFHKKVTEKWIRWNETKYDRAAIDAVWYKAFPNVEPCYHYLLTRWSKGASHRAMFVPPGTPDEALQAPTPDWFTNDRAFVEFLLPASKNGSSDNASVEVDASCEDATNDGEDKEIDAAGAQLEANEVGNTIGTIKDMIDKGILISANFTERKYTSHGKFRRNYISNCTVKYAGGRVSEEGSPSHTKRIANQSAAQAVLQKLHKLGLKLPAANAADARDTTNMDRKAINNFMGTDQKVSRSGEDDASSSSQVDEQRGEDSDEEGVIEHSVSRSRKSPKRSLDAAATKTLEPSGGKEPKEEEALDDADAESLRSNPMVIRDIANGGVRVLIDYPRLPSWLQSRAVNLTMVVEELSGAAVTVSMKMTDCMVYHIKGDRYFTLSAIFI